MAKQYTKDDGVLIKKMLADGMNAYDIAHTLGRSADGVRAYCRKHKLHVHTMGPDTPDGDVVPIPYCDGYFLDIANKEAYSTRNGIMKRLKQQLYGGRPYVSFTMSDGRRMWFSMSKLIYSAEHNIDPRVIKKHNLTINEDGVVEDLVDVHLRSSASRRRRILMEDCTSVDKQISYLRKQAEVCNNVADALSRSDTSAIISILESFRPQAERYLTRIGYTNKEWQKISIDNAIDSVAEDLVKHNRCFILSEFTIGAFSKKQYAMLRKKRKYTLSIDKVYKKTFDESYDIDTDEICE